MNDAVITRPDGSTIAWQAEGPPDATPILLSNSLASDRGMWDPMLPGMVGRYRIVRYDTRGHGASRSARADATLDELVDDALAVLDAARIARAVVVGISLGGMTGLALALREPSRVAGLLACHCRARIDADGIAAWEQRLDVVRRNGTAALVEPTLERWFAAPFRTSAPQAMAAVRRMIAATSPEGYEACVRAIQGIALHDALDRIAVPTGFVVGAQDAAAPIPEMKAMAQRVPGAQLTVLDPCGHLSSIERPEALRAAIDALVARLPAADRGAR